VLGTAFPGDIAAFDALRSGQIYYAYLPIQDISQAQYLTSRGCKTVPRVDFGVYELFINFESPTVGPSFKAALHSEAMQKLFDQPRS
jgi:hypothetical protein